MAVQERGALPYEGYVTDTKIAIQAIMPEVDEPVPGEVVAYGLSLENSDFATAHCAGGDAPTASRQTAGRVHNLLRADG